MKGDGNRATKRRGSRRPVTAEELYATPRVVDDPLSCQFYHRMDIPGYGQTSGGMWDLRPNVDAYLGGIDLAGKRVLEIGPASGYLTFYMESRGAEVVSVELPPEGHWDLVPDVSLDGETFINEMKVSIEGVRNAYWFTHKRMGSKARVYYGDIYDLPDSLGHFDIAVLAAILLHVRDPLRVVEGCARLADALVVTEMRYPEVPDHLPHMSLFSVREDPVSHVWWKLSPQLFVRFAELLGYTDSTVTFHEQLWVADGPPAPGSLYTVVSKKGPAG